MRWIAGIYNLDGQAVEPELLQQLLGPICKDSAGKCRWWIDGPIGIATHTQSSSLDESDSAFSLAAADNRIAIGFDGRIDSRSELLEQLHLPCHNPDSHPDSELLAAAYEQWGIDCLDKICGDYAFSLWDKTQRRLVCARDIFGVRSLFYCFDGKSLIWASRIRQLLALNRISRTLEREYFANYLVRMSLPLALTPYKEVKRLEPAHTLIVENGSFAVKRYWKPDPKRKISYSSSTDYEQHFHELLRRAVKTRLQTDGPVWCELSGGLDSSSITCVTRDLIDEGQVSIKDYSTLSWIYDEAYYSDERNWIHAVIEKCRVTGHLISCDEYYPLQFFGSTSPRWDEPSFQNIFDSLLKRIRDMLRHAGVKIILSGIAGDQVVVPGFIPVYIADLFRRFRFGRVAREVIRWQKEFQLPFATVFMNSCLRPLLRRNLVLFEAEVDAFKYPVPSWITPAFAKTMNMKDRAMCRLVAPPHPSPAFQSQCEHIMETAEILWRGEREDLCEHRYPYLDRQLVEFCLAVPWTELFRPGEPKSLVRRALVGVLPEKVRTRIGGTGPTHAFFLALTKEWSRLEPYLRNPRLADLGCIDPKALHEALRLARAGCSATSPLMLATLSLENWLINTDSSEAISATQLSA
ncbi:MAG TPA: asparagine synthase-related protein [Terriglobales bacterium]